MKKLNNLLLLIFPFLIFIFGCQSHNSSDSNNKEVDTLNYVNITVLLDLSNRIDGILHPDQVQRDTLIIREILNNFSEQVKHNGYIYSKDKIQILIAPQAGNKTINFNPHIEIAEIAKSNKIVRQVLPQSKTQFIKDVTDIYSSKQMFNGADIYTFFKDFPEADFIEKSYEEKSRDGNVFYKYHNKMIIITDGYLNFEPKTQAVRCSNNSCMQMNVLRHDSNWKQNFSKFKLKPIEGKNFQNLEVLLLEINPNHPEINVHESEIIEYYWKQWFNDINIKYIPLHQATEGIPLVNSSVKSFLTK